LNKKFKILRSGQFFKLQVGLTIFEYINKIKVDFACKLLMNKEISITDVAFYSGFNNLSHFNKQLIEKDIHQNEFVEIGTYLESGIYLI